MKLKYAVILRLSPPYRGDDQCLCELVYDAMSPDLEIPLGILPPVTGDGLFHFPSNLQYLANEGYWECSQPIYPDNVLFGLYDQAILSFVGREGLDSLHRYIDFVDRYIASL